jgi:hypothetical protein
MVPRMNPMMKTRNTKNTAFVSVGSSALVKIGEP